jgi:predicted RNA-binding protein with TRAM domain
MREARRALVIIMFTAGASSALRVSLSHTLRRRSAVYGIRATKSYRRLYSTQLQSDAPAMHADESEASPPVAEGQLVVKRQGKLLSPNPLFVPKPYSYLQQLDVRIESLTNLGEGIARVDGWVIMIPHTIPGELVRVKVHRNHNVSACSKLFSRCIRVYVPNS